MKKGLFIGRFQPFHLGHLSAIKQALKQVEFLKIGIGSSQYKDEPRNPYSAETRRSMIQDSLKEVGIKEGQYEIYEIPDIHDNPKWPAHVKGIVGNFDLLFIGNQGIVKELFEKYESLPIQEIEKEIEISATQIRELIQENSQWHEWVPKPVLALIEQAETNQ